MIQQGNGIDAKLPDATFDLDGTVFKMTVLESYTQWLCEQVVFDPLPPDITHAKLVWKEDNTENNYSAHLAKLVEFFIDQVPGKSVSQLDEAARIVANQQKHRRWNVTTALIKTLRSTHNVISISLMPEWLMQPFTEDLGFVALIGSTYVERDGLFTDEAYSIDKGDEYKARRGSSHNLDVHMGDTVGDASLFALARRPVLFNPSWTLLQHPEVQAATVLTSHKDVVTIVNAGEEPVLMGAPYNADAVLEQVRTRS